MANDYSKLPVIVVEDYQPSTSLSDFLLTYKGISNVVLRVDNHELIAYLNEFEVAAIILELGFPIEEGLHVLKQITSNKPAIPIVIITEVNQIDTAVECIKIGAFDYLTKPITAERLAGSIKKALDFRCLNKVASLLRDTPCILNKRFASEGKIESASLPVILPDEVPERLRKAVDYMDVNLSKPLSLACIAQQACLSKYHFSREFKKYIGMSPIRFMMNRRICLATLLLQNKELSVSKVATRSGFYDQSEFTKWFKKATGFTPSWYRKSFATKD